MFHPVDLDGQPNGDPTSGYIIYDNGGDGFGEVSFPELRRRLTSDAIMDFLDEFEPDFAEVVAANSGLYLNDEWLWIGDNYSTCLTRTESGEWQAEVPELGGCMAFGNTKGEALQRLEEAKRAWLERARDEGLDIPKPWLLKPKR